jgi:hypothetical protein
MVKDKIGLKVRLIDYAHVDLALRLLHRLNTILLARLVSFSSAALLLPEPPQQSLKVLMPTRWANVRTVPYPAIS